MHSPKTLRCKAQWVAEINGYWITAPNYNTTQVSNLGWR